MSKVEDLRSTVEGRRSKKATLPDHHDDLDHDDDHGDEPPPPPRLLAKMRCWGGTGLGRVLG